MSMKKPNDTIGNRTRDLPACSAVPDIINNNITSDLQTTETEDVFIFVIPCTIRLESITELEREGGKWIDLAHYNNKWRAFVKTVINIQGP
jgi:hypothetical protein